MRDVILVIRTILLVQSSRIPATLLGHALRTPVRPNAKLGVTKPVGTFILLERFPRGLKRAFSGLPFLNLARLSSPYCATESRYGKY